MCISLKKSSIEELKQFNNMFNSLLCYIFIDKGLRKFIHLES